jgi:hypothetical protein
MQIGNNDMIDFLSKNMGDLSSIEKQITGACFELCKAHEAQFIIFVANPDKGIAASLYSSETGKATSLESEQIALLLIPNISILDMFKEINKQEVIELCLKFAAEGVKEFNAVFSMFFAADFIADIQYKQEKLRSAFYTAKDDLLMIERKDITKILPVKELILKMITSITKDEQQETQNEPEQIEPQKEEQKEEEIKEQ